VTNSCLID